jgi:hypothetical protein
MQARAALQCLKPQVDVWKSGSILQQRISDCRGSLPGLPIRSTLRQTKRGGVHDSRERGVDRARHMRLTSQGSLGGRARSRCIGLARSTCKIRRTSERLSRDRYEHLSDYLPTHESDCCRAIMGR